VNRVQSNKTLILLCFLYRPEYYKITVDEEGMPTQGMGEVIVAKHRNGARPEQPS